MSQREQWPGEPSEDEPDADETDDSDAEPDEGAEPAEDEDTGDEPPKLRVADPNELDVPDDVDLLEGEPRSSRRSVGIVVSRANGEVANKLLEAALAELERIGVSRDHILVMAVPGPFELPLGAMALAKTRRYACILALGSATGPGLVAAEAASGLQLAALETGVPVAFGVLTGTDDDAAERGAEAVRTALEMADLFQQLRATSEAAK